MDKSNTLSNAEETRNNESSKLIEREEVDGTPFHITGTKEMGYAVTFGKYRLSELREKKEDALQELIDQHWNITARLAGVIAEITQQEHLENKVKTLNDTFKQK